MNIKLVSIVLLISLLILPGITGCEDTKDISDSFQDMPAASTELPQVVLQFLMYGSEKKDMKEVLDKVAEASMLNITLDFKWSGGEGIYPYYDFVKTAVAANDAADVFICGKSFPDRMNAAELFRTGKIKDITELLPMYAPSISKRISDGDKAASSIDGRLVTVPPLINMTESITAFVRQDLAAKYQITDINTFDDYERYLQEVKENENGILPGFICGGEFYDIDFISRAFDYVVLDYPQHLVYRLGDPFMKILPWEQTPEFKDSVSMICRWWERGYIGQLYGEKRELASFIGRTGNFDEGTREIDFFNDNDPKLYNAYILYSDKKFQRRGSLDREISCFAFPAASKNTERALMFLNWVQSSQENYDLLMYGISGRHYELDNNRIGIPAGLKGAESPYIGWYNTPFLNVDFLRTSVDDPSTDEAIKKGRESLNQYTAYPLHDGFSPDLSGIQDICDNRTRLYLKKIEEPLNQGKFDVNETDDIINELKNAGTGKIVDETQKQLDSWKVKNR